MTAESESKLLAKLGDALHDAFREAVAQTHKKHVTEQFYAYILFTSPLLEYAVSSFGTEESLTRRADNPQECAQIRWSPPDWEYHGEGEELFAKVNDILGSHLERYGYEEPEYRSRWNIFVATLKHLDGKGVFGSGAARDAVLLNVMWGDQDCVQHVESARELNPRSSYQQYAKHQLPTLHAWAKEIANSQSMYKEESLVRVRRTIAQVEADLNI